ncbi:hypothetical protein L1887_18805 [Cichorium endivia]|nr:hypothetical protein L1887_18805 [Cichorium endivia]
MGFKGFLRHFNPSYEFLVKRWGIPAHPIPILLSFFVLTSFIICSSSYSTTPSTGYRFSQIYRFCLTSITLN